MKSIFLVLLVGASPQLELQGTNGLPVTHWGYDAARKSVFGNARIWDARTGFLKQSLPNATRVLPSSDGRVYLLTRKDGVKELRDPTSGQVLWSLDDGIGKRLQRITEVSDDGKYVLASSKDGQKAVLHDVAAKKAVGAFNGRKDLMTLRFDPSGQAAVVSGFGPFISIVGIPSMRPRFRLKSSGLAISVAMHDKIGRYCAAFRGSGELILGDSKTGKVKRTLKPPKDWKYQGCAFSAHEDEFIAILGAKGGRSILETHRVAGGRVGSYPYQGYSNSGVRTHAERRFISISAGHSVLVWDSEHRHPIHHVGQRAPWLSGVGFSPDSKRFFVSAKSRLYVFDIDSFHLIKTIDTVEATGYPGFGVGWAPDGRIIVKTGRVSLLDVATEKVSPLMGPDVFILSSRLSPSGRYLAAFVRHNPNKKRRKKKAKLQDELRVIDLTTLESLPRQEVDEGPEKTSTEVVMLAPVSGNDLRFDWSGKSFLYGGRVLIRTEKAKRPTFRPNRILPFDGGQATGVFGRNPRIEVLRSRSSATKTIPLPFQFKHLAVSPDGRWVIASDLKGRILFANTQSTRQLRIGIKNQDWLAYTPDGYFMGSRNAGKLAAFRAKGVAYPIEQFAMTRNRPDKVLQYLGLGNPELIHHYKEWHGRRLTRLGIQDGALVAPPGARIISSHAKDTVVKLKFECLHSKDAVARYQLYVNDVATLGSAGVSYKGPGVENVALSTGRNKIELSCLDTSGRESLRELANYTYASGKKPDLFFLGFGVSKYKNTALNLEYAAKDVKDLAGTISKLNPSNFNKVHVETYLDGAVDRAVFSKARDFISQAGPDDLVVVFIAGHGMHDSEGGGGYYFLTHNADPNALSETAAPFETIESLLYETASRRKVFLMDTCESGEMGDDIAATKLALVVPGTLSRGLRRKTVKVVAASSTRALKLGSSIRFRNRYIYNDLLRRSGAVVFSSSSGGELSYESKKFKNGYFTEGVLRALRRRHGADTDGDRKVSINELEGFVRAFVRKESGFQQNPSIDRDNISADIVFPLR